jgi:hypothetical protein
MHFEWIAQQGHNPRSGTAEPLRVAEELVSQSSTTA